MLSHVATRAGDQVGLLAFDARVRAFLPPQSGRRAAQRVVAASYDIHAQIVETDFEAAYGYLRSACASDPWWCSSPRSSTRYRQNPWCEPCAASARATSPGRPLSRRDPGRHGRAAPHRTGIKVADLYQRAAAAEAILWRDRLVRDLQEAGALVLRVSPRKLTPTLINRYLHIKAQRLL